MCENIPAYIKCCLKSALTLTMIPLHRYLQQFVIYRACTAKDRCLCASPALTHLLLCVSTVLRGALRLQHEPHKEPSTRQRTNQVSVVLSLCFFSTALSHDLLCGRCGAAALRALFVLLKKDSEERVERRRARQLLSMGLSSIWRHRSNAP